MTLEEAANILDRRTTIPGDGYTYEQINGAIDLAIAALRTPTRDQVEKVWRGEWIDCSNGWMCSRCECDNTYAKLFCPSCGAAMTDEALEMVMERWKEAIDGETD